MDKKIKISILLSVIFYPETGFCYIDPGSLNAIWQFLAAFLIGIVTAFSFVRMKIKEIFYKIFKKEKLNDIDEIEVDN
tara:strand:- start:256 stop:489 length:234 start_codon:yes stop_codon:yes gene_type:complete